jgi:hypothetical protein
MYLTAGETTTPRSTSASTIKYFASRPKRRWMSARVAGSFRRSASPMKNALCDQDDIVRYLIACETRWSPSTRRTSPGRSVALSLAASL